MQKTYVSTIVRNASGTVIRVAEYGYAHRCMRSLSLPSNLFEMRPCCLSIRRCFPCSISAQRKSEYVLTPGICMPCHTYQGPSAVSSSPSTRSQYNHAAPERSWLDQSKYPRACIASIASPYRMLPASDESRSGFECARCDFDLDLTRSDPTPAN